MECENPRLRRNLRSQLTSHSFFRAGLVLPIEVLSPHGDNLKSATRLLSSYSGRLNRDLSELDWGKRVVLLGGRWSDLLSHCDGCELLYLGGDLQIPLQLSAKLGPGTVTAVGAFDYDGAELEQARGCQRVLPLTELDWDVAFKTAVSELGPGPVVVSLNLSLFSGPLALPMRDFLQAIDVLDGLVAIQIWSESPKDSLFEAGACCLRECLLSW